MPSPFPGMNPYLERPARWRGFQSNFLVYLQATLTPQLVPRYHVEIEESLDIDPTGDDRHLFAAVAVIAAPVTATIPRAGRKKALRLVIYDTESREVVTVIELSSTSSKAGGRTGSSTCGSG